MKIVLTGGPSAGKTSIVDILNRSESERTQVVQEAASLLYRGGFPRSAEAVRLKCQQRAIFQVQKELEEIAALDGGNRTLICDRGTLDGLAYWPEDEAGFFTAMQSSMEAEIARYDWVIHLDTTFGEHYQTTSIRREGQAEARVVNEKVKQAWRLHPNRLIVEHETEFLRKVKKVLRAVTLILEKQTVESIQAQLSSL